MTSIEPIENFSKSLITNIGIVKWILTDYYRALLFLSLANSRICNEDQILRVDKDNVDDLSCVLIKYAFCILMQPFYLQK